MFFVLLAPYVCFHNYRYVWVTEWPTIGKIAAHSAYDMFSWYKLELKYRVEKISKIKRVEDELFLLIFSTMSLTNL